MFELFQYDFMVRALWAGVLIALVAPTIGLFLVVRGYSLLSDTLAHVSLAGVAAGALLGINPILSALVFSVGSAGVIARMQRSRFSFGESGLAVFLSGSLALAVILFSLGGGLGSGLTSALFGSIATVGSTDLWIMFALTVVVLAVVFVLYRALFLMAFNETLAHAQGLPARALEVLMIVLAAVVISFSMRVVGVLLIGAMMVVPPLTAMRYRLSFKMTHVLSVLFALISVLGGLALSFYINLPSGATMVMLALLLLVASAMITRKGV